MVKTTGLTGEQGAVASTSSICNVTGVVNEDDKSTRNGLFTIYILNVTDKTVLACDTGTCAN